MLKSIWFKLLRLIKGPPPPPTLQDAWQKLYDLVDAYDDALFYLHLAHPINLLPEEFRSYAERAEFNLSSARDELKIFIDNNKKQAALDEINARVAKERANVKS